MFIAAAPFRGKREKGKTEMTSIVQRIETAALVSLATGLGAALAVGVTIMAWSWSVRALDVGAVVASGIRLW